MRYSLNSGLTGSPLLDFILMGVAFGAGAHALMSILGGKIPGPGMIPAAIAGGIVASILFVFKSGMNL